MFKKIKLNCEFSSMQSIVSKIIRIVSIDKKIKVEDVDVGDDIQSVKNFLGSKGILLRKVKLQDIRNIKNDVYPVLAFQKKSRQPVLLYKQNNYNLELEDICYIPYPMLSKGFDSISGLLKIIFSMLLEDKVLILLIGALSALFSLLPVVISSQIIDQVIPNSNLQYLGLIILLFVICTCSSLLCNAFNDKLLFQSMIKVEFYLFSGLFQKVLKFPLKNIRKFETADLAERIFSFTNVLSPATNFLLSLPYHIFTFIFYLGVLLMINYSLSLLYIITCTVLFLGEAMFIAIYNNYKQCYLKESNAVVSKTTEIINSITKIRANNKEDKMFDLWFHKLIKQKNQAITLFNMNNINEVIQKVIWLINSIILYAIVINYKDTLSVSALFVFFVASSNFNRIFLILFTNVSSLLKDKSTIKRLNALVQPDNKNDNYNFDIPKLVGEITMKNIEFSYNIKKKMLINELCLNIKPGEFIGFTGKTGAGKSTIFKILLGLENIQAGEIFFDNIKMSSKNIFYIRKQIGCVLQTSKLFTGTIYYNIDPTESLSTDEAWELASFVGLDRDLQTMPMGMFTLIGESMGTISGGQKQKILLARALSRKPSILLLDEATSAMDNESQGLVQKNLDTLNITRLAIAHRLSTLSNADKIYSITSSGDVKLQK